MVKSVGTRMNGLYIIKNDKIEKVPFSITGNNGTISLQIREFVEDDDKNIWFGTFLGLQKFDIKKQQFSAIKIPKYAGGLNHPSIFSMYRDREGNIWAGSYYGGVNYFNPTHSAFLHYDYQVGEMSNLYYSYIGEMVLDKRDNLWISTDGGGISCVDRSWNLLDVLIAGEGNSLPHNNVKSICYDEEHDMLYIGTHLGGLSRYDIKTGKFYNYLDKKGQENAPGNIIHRIRKWKNYIIVSCREGVFSLDTNTDLFTKLESFMELQLFLISLPTELSIVHIMIRFYQYHWIALQRIQKSNCLIMWLFHKLQQQSLIYISVPWDLVCWFILLQQNH